jgi:hypothetical protein
LPATSPIRNDEIAAGYTCTVMLGVLFLTPSLNISLITFYFCIPAMGKEINVKGGNNGIRTER